MVVDGYEICSYGYCWIDYQYMDEVQECEYMFEVICIFIEFIGQCLVGWYIGCIGLNIWCLVMEEGGFFYDFDIYDDDLFYWDLVSIVEKLYLVIFYILDINDMCFIQVQGFNNGEQFFQYLKDVFDVFYEEGVMVLKMFFIGLYCWLIGCLVWMVVLECFIQYVQSYDKVWFVCCEDIVCYWYCEYFFQEIEV